VLNAEELGAPPSDNPKPPATEELEVADEEEADGAPGAGPLAGKDPNLKLPPEDSDDELEELAEAAPNLKFPPEDCNGVLEELAEAAPNFKLPLEDCDDALEELDDAIPNFKLDEDDEDVNSAGLRVGVTLSVRLS